MGYGGKTVNGLSSLGPKMGGKAHGGGVKIEKNKISQSQDNVLSGKFTSMGSAKIVGKGMMKYLAGEPVGMAKYKSAAQRKAAHASMAEGAGKYGKHMGPEKELVGKQENLPEALKSKIEAAPGKYGHKKSKGKLPKSMKDEAIANKKKMKGKGEKAGGPNKYGKHKGPKKADYDKDMAEERIQIKDDKKKIFQDDKKKRDSEGPAKERTAVKSVNEIDGKKDNYSYQKPVKTETLKEVKKPRKASKEIAKSKIEAGKKLKKEGRQEKRAARKNARKIKRSARLDKKIALQEFKGKQKVKSGDQQGAKAKRDRVENLKARKAKK